MHNEDKNLFRQLGTVAVLLMLALAVYMVGILAGVLGFESLQALGKTAAIVFLVLMAVCGYSRYLNIVILFLTIIA